MLESVLGEYSILFCRSGGDDRQRQARAEALLPLLDASAGTQRTGRNQDS